MAHSKATSEHVRASGAKVISIDSRLADSRSRHPVPAPPSRAAEPITQARLAQALQLHLEEMRITQALREFRLQLEADLASGAQIERGDLRYDPELKIVRRSVTNATFGG